jgi:hypothetical protein
MPNTTINKCFCPSPQVLNERLRFDVVVVDVALPLKLLVTMMPPVGFFVPCTVYWNLPPVPATI